MKHSELLENILIREILDVNLKFAAVFIATYENFEAAIVDNVRDFYCI